MKNLKNLTKLVLGVSSLSLLASCSTMGANDTVAKPEPMKAKPVKVEPKVVAPTAKIVLKEVKEDSQIKAFIHTTYNDNPEGSVKLNWVAPKNTSCYNTVFPITKYGETNDATHASVKLNQGNKFCAGTWIANVLYKGKAIATASINIEKAPMKTMNKMEAK